VASCPGVKAALLAEYGRPFEVDDVTPMTPNADDVVVRMTASAYCYTDCLNQRGMRGLPRTLPTIVGHAAVGIVERAGPEVTRVRNGDHVLVPGTPECGRCFWCRKSRPDQCEHLLAPARPVAHRADGTPVVTGIGTYTELITIRGSWAFPLHSDLPDETLSLLGCGVTTGLGAALNVGQVQPGDSVAVVGCGHLGLWMIQGARLAGAERIIAVEPLAWRLDVARALGATDVVNPAHVDPVEAVRDLTDGRGADVTLEASGPPEGIEQAFAMTRRAGTSVITGVSSQASTVTLPQTEVAIRGKRILSCQMGQTVVGRDVPRYVEMLEDGRLDAAPIITGVFPLERINDANEAAAGRNALTGVIVP
jgi:S-(hydroxymethyl)glutathione dehydrogenase/alcohol dehydrogenase